MSTENQPSTTLPAATTDNDPATIPTITLKGAANGVMMITKSAGQTTTELHVDTADGKRNPTLSSRLAQVLSTGKNPLLKPRPVKQRPPQKPPPEYNPKAKAAATPPPTPPATPLQPQPTTAAPAAS